MFRKMFARPQLLQETMIDYRGFALVVQATECADGYLAHLGIRESGQRNYCWRWVPLARLSGTPVYADAEEAVRETIAFGKRFVDRNIAPAGQA